MNFPVFYFPCSPLPSFSLFESRPFSFVYFLPQDYYNSLVSAAMKRNDADLQVVKPKLPSLEIKALKITILFNTFQYSSHKNKNFIYLNLVFNN